MCFLGEPDTLEFLMQQSIQARRWDMLHIVKHKRVLITVRNFNDMFDNQVSYANIFSFCLISVLTDNKVHRTKISFRCHTTQTTTKM